MKLLRTMKLIAILLTTTCLQVSAYTSAQVSFSLREVGLDKVFTEIEKQTGMPVLFNWPDLAGTKKVTLQFTNATYQQVLQKALEGQPLAYEVKNGGIVVYRRNLEFKQQQNPNRNEKFTLKGKIVNTKDEPVIGATIKVKESNHVTISDDKGEFMLENIESNSTLLVTSVNFQPKVFKLNKQTNVTIVMEFANAILSEIEVVYNTGFQEVAKERATGSFVKVDNKLFNRAVSTDVLSRIKGIASGVLFDNTNNINGNTTDISVRGASTIFANAKPLIILDNFPYQGDINSINPNDVESITILKDAAAASIWGAFSGNGVIVIKSKNGKYNQPISISFNNNITVGSKPDLYYDRAFLQSKSFINVEKSLFEKGFYDPDIDNIFTWPVLSPVVEILLLQRNQEIDAEEATRRISKLALNDIRDDYSKYFYRTPVIQQYSMNISGGTDKYNYYLSGGYDRNTQNIVKTNNDRFTLNGMLTASPVKNLEITSRFQITQQQSTNNGFTSVNSGGMFSRIALPYTRLADDAGNPLAIIKDYRSTYVNNLTISGLQDWTYIPLNELNLNNNNSKLLDNRIEVGISYKLLKGLRFNLNYQYQKSINDYTNLFDKESYYVRNLVNIFSEVANNEVTKRNFPIGSILSAGYINTVFNSFRGAITYERKLATDHEISSIIGIDIRESKTEGKRTYAYGYDDRTGSFSNGLNYNTVYPTLPSGSATIPVLSSAVIPYNIDRFRSYYGNFGYTYKGRYTLTGSARIDQSNLFGVKTNQKSVPLWSSGLKWDLHKEDFLHSKAIQRLSIRSTLGYNGNLDRSLTALTIAAFQGIGTLNNIPYSDILRPGNPQLRWERIKMFNVGVDFSIFNDIVSGTLEYYIKHGKDLIGDANMPTSSGVPSARGNYASMKAKGYDVTISTNNLTRDVKWQTTLLFSHVTDKITKNEGLTNFFPGESISTIYSYQWAGLDPETGDPQGILENKISKDYATIINTTTLDRSKYIKHRSSPSNYGSIRNDISFKGVGVSFNLIGKFGYYFRKSTISYQTLYYNGIGNVDYEKRWMKPGDEQNTTVPSEKYIDDPDFSNRETFYLNSEATIVKGDHVRLQDVSLSYDIGSLLKSRAIKSFQVYSYINNIGIIWKSNKEGIDPDFQTGYPTPKTFTFGVRIGL